MSAQGARELKEKIKALTWACEQREKWQKEAESKLAAAEARLAEIEKERSGQ